MTKVTVMLAMERRPLSASTWTQQRMLLQERAAVACSTLAPASLAGTEPAFYFRKYTAPLVTGNAVGPPEPQRENTEQGRLRQAHG